MKLSFIEVMHEIGSRDYSWNVRSSLFLRGMAMLKRLNHEIAEIIERELYFAFQAPLYSFVLRDIKAINSTVDQLLWASHTGGPPEPLIVFKSRLRMKKDVLSGADRRTLLAHTACMGYPYFEYALEVVHDAVREVDFHELCRRYYRILVTGYRPSFRVVLGSERFRSVDPGRSLEHGIPGGPISWGDFGKLLGRYYTIPLEFAARMKSNNFGTTYLNNILFS